MRESNLSCIRLIAMIMIISCHILQGLSLEAAFWLNLGVQIFFILSGYLYGKKKISNISAFYKKQYLKIIVPYAILYLILLFLGKFNIGREILFSKFTILGDLLGFQSWIGTNVNLSHTWFISYILLCYLITPLLEKIVQNKKENNLLFLLLTLTIFLQIFVSYKVLNINVSYIMLYVFGYFLSSIEEKKSDNKIIIPFLVLTILIFPFRIMVQYYNNEPIIYYLNYFNIGKDAFLSYHHALCGITIFLILKKILKKVRYNKILAFSDKYSYYIYLTHQIFILYDFSILHKFNSLFLNILLILIAIIISGLSLYYITQCFNKMINILKKKRRVERLAE